MCQFENLKIILILEANVLGFVSEPYSRFPLYKVPLQSGLKSNVGLIYKLCNFALCKHTNEQRNSTSGLRTQRL